MNFDEFLNFAIPIILLIVAIAWLYFKFAEPIRSLFSWIGQLFNTGADKLKQQPQQAKEIVWN